MFNPLRFFRKKFHPSYIGVDIGTTSIKIVEVEKGEHLPRITNYAILESKSSLTRANTVFQTSSLKLFEAEIAELLKLTIARMKLKGNEAIASLPGFSAFITLLSLPEMNPAELQNAITFQARQYIPSSLSDVQLDWIKVGEHEDPSGLKYQQVLLISVPQDTIKKYQDIFRRAGLTLTALEIESLSLARSLVGTDPTPTAIADIGSRSTTIAIVDQGGLIYASQTDFAGSSLTQAIASSLSINPVRAEELKRERGILTTGPNYELSTIMLPFLDGILSEVKRAITAYEAQLPGAPKLERCIVSGGGANLLGIEKYFTSQLGFPSVKAAPFARFEYPAALEPVVPELNPDMSVALGLVLREFA